MIELQAHGQQQLIQADIDEALLTELPVRPTPPCAEHVETAEQQRSRSLAQPRRLQRQFELSELAKLSPHSFHHGLRNVVEPAIIIATPKGDRLIELIYPQFDLRARQVVQLPEVALDLLEPLDEVCEGSWTVTVSNQPGVLHGRFELLTVAAPYALARTWPRDSFTTGSGWQADRGRDVDVPGAGVGPRTGGLRTTCGILDDVNPFLLAAAGELPSTKLRLRLQKAAEEIGSLDDTAFNDPQAVIEQLIRQYAVPLTEYQGEPTIIGERDYQMQAADWPHSNRMAPRHMWDYTVAIDFVGDAALVRASFATCMHEPQWSVHGNQIRAVFSVERTAPADDLRRWIRERAADAVRHLEQTRGDTDRYHEELNALLEDMVPKMVAMRLAGQRQREELGLPFAEVTEDERAPRLPMNVPLPYEATSPDALFQEVIEALRSAATTLAANIPLVVALDTEDLMRSELVVFLKGRLDAPFVITEETFHGQGKVDIAIHWHGQLIGIAECKVWHSESKLKDGIDQVLSYLTHSDTRVAYVVFIRQQNVTQIVENLKRMLLSHDNCADHDLPEGTDRIDFNYHATGDTEQKIKMVLLPMPLTTSATGTSADRGLSRSRRTSGPSAERKQVRSK